MLHVTEGLVIRSAKKESGKVEYGDDWYALRFRQVRKAAQKKRPLLLRRARKSCSTCPKTVCSNKEVWFKQEAELQGVLRYQLNPAMILLNTNMLFMHKTHGVCARTPILTHGRFLCLCSLRRVQSSQRGGKQREGAQGLVH
eukprot:4213746-Pyramimonas_sp.AAC.1